MVAISLRQPTPTELAIAEAFIADGGAKFRGLQEKWFPLIKDAYNTKVESGRRSHYGFSGAGDNCDRALWLRWRWMNENQFTKKPQNTNEAVKQASMMRLVNRGHLEEARFMAILEMIGVHIAEPENGQERVSALSNNAGSALDALMYNTPCIPNEWQLGEFKTMNDKNFKELTVKGVRNKKPEHYVQMQLCMLTRGIHKTLYMVVNKNNDEIYTEVVEFNEFFANNQLAKIDRIIYAPSAPAKISGDPSSFSCKFCDCHSLCQMKQYEPERTCRSCVAATLKPNSSDWLCGAQQDAVIDKATMAVGCDRYIRINI